MRIFISGAQRVGKTTVAKELAKRLNLSYLDAKVSQAIKESGNTKPDDHLESNDFYKQMKIQDFVYKHIDKVVNEETNFVTDRCLMDVNAYTAYIISKQPEDFIHSDEYSAYENLYVDVFCSQVDLFQSYDTITFVINPSKDFPFVPDEKSGGEASQKFVAEDIINQLYEFDICGHYDDRRVFVIPDECTGVENRVQWCLAKINAIQKSV